MPSSRPRDQLVIGLAGPAGVGKSTLARAIVNAYPTNPIEQSRVRIMSFADPIRDMLRALGVPEAAIVGDKAAKERPCAELCGASARQAMRLLGTEWGREGVHRDLWVAAWLRRLAETPEPVVVVDDVRFENEVAAIREVGGVIIGLARPSVRYERDHASETGVSPDLAYELRDRDAQGAAYGVQVSHVVDEARRFAEQRRLRRLREAWQRFAAPSEGGCLRDFARRLALLVMADHERDASASSPSPLVTLDELRIVAEVFGLEAQLDAEALAAEEAAHHDPGPAERGRRQAFGALVDALTGWSTSDVSLRAAVVSPDDDDARG